MISLVTNEFGRVAGCAGFHQPASFMQGESYSKAMIVAAGKILGGGLARCLIVPQGRFKSLPQTDSILRSSPPLMAVRGF